MTNLPISYLFRSTATKEIGRKAWSYPLAVWSMTFSLVAIGAEVAQGRELSSSNGDANGANEFRGKEKGSVQDEKNMELPWFPDWQGEEFSYGISPIVGVAEQEVEGKDFHSRNGIMEIGILLGVNGIPVVPENPGLSLGGEIGKAWGRVDQIPEKKQEEKAKGTAYDRTYGQVSATLLAGCWRDQLTLKRGMLIYGTPGELGENTHSWGAENDIGLLLLPPLSAHYTVSLDEAWQKSQDRPFLESTSHWLHARLSIRLVHTVFDVGPGYTVTDQEVGLDDQELNHRFQDHFFKARLASHPFWKIAIQGSAKYIVDSKGEMSLAGLRLPQDGVYTPVETGLPADSLSSSGFLGLHHVLGGLGVGYQVNLLETNMHDAEKKSTVRNSGWVLTYTTTF